MKIFGKHTLKFFFSIKLFNNEPNEILKNWAIFCDENFFNEKTQRHQNLHRTKTNKKVFWTIKA